MQGPNIMSAMNDELLTMAAPKEEPAPEPASVQTGAARPAVR